MATQAYLPDGTRTVATIRVPQKGILLGVLPGSVFLCHTVGDEETFVVGPAFTSLTFKEHHLPRGIFGMWAALIVFALAMGPINDLRIEGLMLPPGGELVFVFFLLMGIYGLLRSLYIRHLVVFTASLGRETVTYRTRRGGERDGILEFMRTVIRGGSYPPLASDVR